LGTMEGRGGRAFLKVLEKKSKAVKTLRQARLISAPASSPVGKIKGEGICHCEATGKEGENKARQGAPHLQPIERWQWKKKRGRMFGRT